MSQPDQVEAEPTSLPFELEPVEDPDPNHYSNPHHNPDLVHHSTEHSTHSEPEPEEQFSSVSLDQSEAQLNSCQSPSFRDSFAPTSTTHHHPTLSPTTSTDNSLSATTQPSSTHSINQDDSHSKPEGDSTAKADAHPDPPAPAPGPLAPPVPTPTPQPKQSTSAQTTMQKVVSLTRQRDLPPKSKEEERKHLRELEAMLTASKEAEKRRKQSATTAHLQRAARHAAALPTWEARILPNWHEVLKADAGGRALKQLWWDGTMPVIHRGRLWNLCIGNALGLGKSAYAQVAAHARKVVAAGEFGEADRRRMDADVAETLPTLKMFQVGGVMHEDLVELLVAYSVYSPGEEAHYPQGLSYLGAMLLLNMAPNEAFVALVNLIHKSCLKSFYSSNPDEKEGYFRVFDTLLADYLAKVYSNFSSQVVRPSLYLTPWLTTVFVKYLPLDLSTRLLDVFLLEGDSFLFRAALVLLQLLEPRLFTPSHEELEETIQGEDRGAVAIVRREKAIGFEDGPRVERDEVFTEMGLTEDTIFAGLERLAWKEETWARLVDRELPDAD